MLKVDKYLVVQTTIGVASAGDDGLVTRGALCTCHVVTGHVSRVTTLTLVDILGGQRGHARPWQRLGAGQRDQAAAASLGLGTDLDGGLAALVVVVVEVSFDVVKVVSFADSVRILVRDGRRGRGQGGGAAGGLGDLLGVPRQLPGVGLEHGRRGRVARHLLVWCMESVITMSCYVMLCHVVSPPDTLALLNLTASSPSTLVFSL